jgi:hypothetical protein
MRGMDRFLFLSFVLLSIFCVANSKVIITHGAFNKDAAWYEKGGYFFDVVAQSAKDLGQEVVSFTWQQDLGGITHYERIKAGVQLSKDIIDYILAGEKEIVLIGHSYGGHVIKVASQLLSYTLINLEKESFFVEASKDKEKVVVDEPVLEAEESVTEIAKEDAVVEDIEEGSEENNEEIEVVVEETENKEVVIEVRKLTAEELERLVEFIEVNEFFEAACKEVKRYKDEKLAGRAKNKDFLIDSAYTLGTPNDIPDYVADMNVIGYLYNFYSDGDLVQDLVGAKLLPEPKHERAVNLCVEMKSSCWFGLWGLPKHTELHAEIIGQWILSIPFVLMENKIGYFDLFSFSRDGKIKFTENKPPVYEAMENATDEIIKHDLAWLFNQMNIFKNLC